ncbi:MAG: GTPase [Lachnospiraceae bacterium]|nr:GTPase [Lachnospiraceae bacterium]
MKRKKREVLFYLFTGFLESGKTSFLKETLSEGQFMDGKKTVYLVCEEGIEEIDQETLKKNKFTLINIDSEEEVTIERFLRIDETELPDRVVVEYNGTWDIDKVMEAMPEGWEVVECIATVDAGTYEQYLANMKMMMLNQFTYADLILFNRCSDEMDLASFKRTARAKNRRAQVVFEMQNGEINNDVKEELPYDINAPVIKIEDDDFGIWYLDAFDNLQNYEGKTVSFKGMVYKPGADFPGNRKDIFVPGRFAMTCCAADIQFVGFPCKFEGAKSLEDRSFVMVNAKVASKYNEELEQDAPFLIAESVQWAPKPEEEVVYFQ